MKLQLKELHPNPFKKNINGGELNEEIINKIQANINELGLMGALPVFKKDDKYFLIAGHHRVEALKRAFNKSHEIEVTVHNYTEDQILRGMVVENLTQRTDELIEVTENLGAIRNHLIDNKIIIDDKGLVQTSPDHANITKGIKGFQVECGSSEQVHRWLNKNNSGKEIMSLTKIKDFLRIADNLDRRLLKNTVKTDGGINKEGKLSIEDAKNLSRLDKKEQFVMKELLDETGLDHKEKGKLITVYNESTPETKEKVKEGKIELNDLKIENFKQEIKKKAEEQLSNKAKGVGVTFIKRYQRDAGNKIGDTNDRILKTCAFFDTLEKQGILYDLDWNTMYQIIEAGQVGGKRYTKFMEGIINKL